MGIGDWGLGPIPNPQSPIPNPQSPIPIYIKNKFIFKGINKIINNKKIKIKIKLYHMSKFFKF